MRVYLAILFAIALALNSRAANVGQGAPKGAESLGNRLLDDLSPEVPRSVAPQPQQQPAAAPTNSFGIGNSPTAQSLTQVRQGMQSAEALLAQPGLGASGGTIRLAGTVQQKVLSDLDQLIAQLSKQCQGGQCNGGQCNGDKPSDKPGQKPGKSGSAKGTGKTAARDSTDRLDRTTAKSADKGEVNEMVKALWGQLPERSREQMQQSFSDEFLPKYELEIEQYYRRLSEEQNETSPK
jgi:hypothetical protein